MILRKFNWRLFVILLIGSIIRFYYLGIVPPSLAEVRFLRFVSAVSGVFSIYLIYILAKKIFKDKKTGLFVALALAILPLHIVESRIVSWVSIAILFFIIGGIVYYGKTLVGKVAGVIIILFSLYLGTRNTPFTVFVNSFPTFTQVLNNFFNIISFNKVFFANDSYWVGGLRRFGMICPELIPLYLVGLYQLVSRKKKAVILIGLLIIIVAVLNPFFPEAREIGLLAPLFALIIGLGFNGLFSYIKSTIMKKGPVKFGLLICCGYLAVLVYGVFNFFHFYFIHYNLQVEQERSYEIYKF